MKRLVALALVLVACGGTPDPGSTTTTTSDSNETPTTTASTTTVPSLARAFGEPPAVPDGPLSRESVAAVDAVFERIDLPISPAAVAAFADTGDARLAWLLADILRFSRDPEVNRSAVDAASALTGIDFSGPVPWVSISDHLLAWDLSAPPDYESYKARLFIFVEPRWAIAFADGNTIDDRLLSWGGVLPDDRPFGATGPCEGGCIPALDEPAVTPAAAGAWYPDDRIVFGVAIDGSTRAYPKHIMEVHEMVNDTLGGRDFALPYCTLCGSAQLFFTDDVTGFDRPVLRTSGLLSRSNKVMYDLLTGSVFDTFRGEAVAGPMSDAGIVLDQGTVVVSTWGAWRGEHPDTTIVAQDGGIGRVYDLDPLGGRDDEGPIFPIGDRDLRLGVQDQVLGVILPDGTAVAFPVDEARQTLDAGGTISLEGVSLHQDAGGLIAVDAAGNQIASHQSFWFAWSQFHPDTLLWTG